jgi:hypothetical protein
MNNEKVCYRFFTPWQEDKEIKWLESMSAKGWHLQDVRIIKYIFLKGDPENILYRLDHRILKNNEVEDYIQIFEDAGWKNVARANHWFYFSADAETVAGNDIFSDNQSRIQKYRSVLTVLLVAGFPLFYFTIFRFPFKIEYARKLDLFYSIAHILMAIIAFILVYSIIRIFILIRKLQNSPGE